MQPHEPPTSPFPPPVEAADSAIQIDPPADERWGGRRSPRMHLFLFGATLVTTTIAGSFNAGVDPFAGGWAFLAGFPFSLTLLAILLCHEFGHYTLARWHDVPTTLPYFIPGPPFLVGTFGAFIRMYGMPRTRRALFDVGAAGPWGGMIVALPAVAIGLAWSEVEPLAPPEGVSLALGNSILFDLLTRLVLGVDPDEATVLLHPVALAGWFGLFVTFLNLLPVGQLDGGHVVYALFGRRHRTISWLCLAIVVALGLYGWDGWLVWAILLFFVLRIHHPDTVDADTPLDPARRTAAWLTIGLFLLTFMPVPLSMIGEEESPARPPTSLPRRDPRPAPGSDDGMQLIGVSLPPPPVVPSST